ncbi:hypothetical protein [Kaistella jeonii]|uniref:T9SS C-terminal target domain-containing protein n=1 Tax=Kaistella jeonii TaxID=266749 RepID=A0A0C1FBH1_9FLAO|nr:hypothetical protein [Kaistella jeonii]KIA90457.1 hypothetical protein OA86_00735 [Kaistella jeonii]SFB72557.1 hypothetical protein SAMN05421876_101386 [Kaistella jeonii]VEI94976.1 Uncharacterised protein [Kaistella jeonii]
MNKFYLIIIFFISLSFSAQKEDQWLKMNRFEVAVLSDSLKENSGLEFYHKRLLTFNDSGNSSDIFEIDKTSGKIKNVFKTNLKNIDWESITSDSTHIYIGDFGNNAGTRKDMNIYKIPFDSLEKGSTSMKAQKIPFYYPEQKDFTSKNLNNNFDGEAIIFLNGKIHIFTKEWKSRSTTHYILDPNISENQSAEKAETFHTGYVVTDAAYFDKKLYLIGYTKKTEVFLSIFNETNPGVFFEQKPRRYYLGSALSIGQIEGIAVDDEGVYISGEEFITPFLKSKQRLYFISSQKLK